MVNLPTELLAYFEYFPKYILIIRYIKYPVYVSFNSIS